MERLGTEAEDCNLHAEREAAVMIFREYAWIRAGKSFGGNGMARGLNFHVFEEEDWIASIHIPIKGV